MAKARKMPKTDRELLRELKRILWEKISGGKVSYIAQMIRVLEIEKKIVPAEDAQSKFWEMIEQIRQEELGPEKFGVEISAKKNTDQQPNGK